MFLARIRPRWRIWGNSAQKTPEFGRNLDSGDLLFGRFLEKKRAVARKARKENGPFSKHPNSGEIRICHLG